jgi:hypothetical protein
MSKPSFASRFKEEIEAAIGIMRFYWGRDVPRKEMAATLEANMEVVGMLVALGPDHDEVIDGIREMFTSVDGYAEYEWSFVKENGITDSLDLTLDRFKRKFRPEIMAAVRSARADNFRMTFEEMAPLLYGNRMLLGRMIALSDCIYDDLNTFPYSNVRTCIFRMVMDQAMENLRAHEEAIAA